MTRPLPSGGGALHYFSVPLKKSGLFVGSLLDVDHVAVIDRVGCADYIAVPGETNIVGRCTEDGEERVVGDCREIASRRDFFLDGLTSVYEFDLHFVLFFFFLCFLFCVVLDLFF